jgi:hypothetical protein
VRFAVHGPGCSVASPRKPHVLSPGLHELPRHGLPGEPREQLVAVHANVLSTTTDVSGEVKRRVLLSRKGGAGLPRTR